MLGYVVLGYSGGIVLDHWHMRSFRPATTLDMLPSIYITQSPRGFRSIGPGGRDRRTSEKAFILTERRSPVLYANRLSNLVF